MAQRSASSDRTVEGPAWEPVTESAGWSPRDSAGEVVFKDAMWILGGWVGVNDPNPRDVWTSSDGIRWNCVQPEAPWLHSDLPMVYTFQDRIWIMGGRRVPGKENSNSVWSSADGVHWDLVSPSAGWTPRMASGHVVFDGKMWVLGGTEDFYDGNSATLHNDIWTTEDGITWREVIPHAPWTSRAFHQAIVFKGKLWVIGGGSWLPTNDLARDVWCSDNGSEWTLVTDNPPWDGRIWFSLLVYRDHLWLLGGWSKEHGNFNDVWFTDDGYTWKRLESPTIWNPRHEQSGFVFHDKLWIMGGHAYPLNNEVWTLSLPETWH